MKMPSGEPIEIYGLVFVDDETGEELAPDALKMSAGEYMARAIITEQQGGTGVIGGRVVSVERVRL